MFLYSVHAFQYPVLHYIFIHIYIIIYGTYYVPLYTIYMKYTCGAHMICYSFAVREFIELFQISFDSLFSHFLGKQQDYKNSCCKVSRHN